MESQRKLNTSYVLTKLGMSTSKFESMMVKIDKDYHCMMGLSRRLKVPDDLDIEQAKLLKMQMQERLMELWNSSSTLSNTLQTERLLQILEAFTEDELMA